MGPLLCGRGASGAGLQGQGAGAELKWIRQQVKASSALSQQLVGEMQQEHFASPVACVC
jgi:hypothetical protein